MSGVSITTARRQNTASLEGTPEVRTAPAGVGTGTTARTGRTNAALQTYLPKFKRAARKLDTGVQHVIASQVADVWQSCRHKRPFAKSRRNRSGLQVIKTAERSFVIAPAAADIHGPAASAATAGPRFVVLERIKDDPKNGKAKQSRFHPVCTDLSVDKAVSFYRQDDGTWSVHGGASASGTDKWLASKDADRLVSLRAGSGVTTVGSRELCGVTLHTGHDMTTQKQHAVIAREATADGNRYRLLDNDLRPGSDVAPIDGSPAEQPFIHDLLNRVVKQYRWPEGDALPLAQHVAVTAFRAGASVADAATLSESILLAAHANLGDRAKPAYGQVAAAAGNMLRQGMSLAQVTDAAHALLRSAEWLHAGAPDPAPTAEVAPATGDVAEAAEAGGVDETALTAQRTTLRAAQGATFAGFSADVQRMRTETRRDHGPMMSALQAVAREHYVEKVDDVATLRAVAGRAAGTAISALRDRADSLNSEADSADAEVSKTRALLERATEAAALHDAGSDDTAHRTNMPAQPESPWLLRFLGLGARRPSSAPEVSRDAAASHAANTAALDATLHAHEARATSLRNRAQSVSARADSLERTASPCVTAMVSAVLDAKAHAPSNQAAALNAGTAAWQATANGTDAAGAALAGRTTHLASLTGADNDAAQTAGMYMAVLCRNGAVTSDAAGIEAAHAYQLTLTQAAMRGDRPWTQADSESAMLGALAVLPIMNTPEAGPKKNRLRAADMLKAPVPEISAADTVPPVGVDRLLFARTDRAAKKTPLSASAVSGIPAHYEAVPTRFDSATAEPVPGLNHAKIRTVTDAGFQSPSGIGATHYMIELASAQGRHWVDFDWSANTNQLYGEVSIKPTRPPRADPTRAAESDAAADDDVGGQAKVLVAYNGFSARWEAMTQRTSDLKVRTDAAMREIDHLITSRDATLSWRNLSYEGAKSGHLDNVVPHVKTRVEEEIRLFAQGRHTQPQFKDNMSKLFIDLAQSVESDRSRKKAISRHQLDTTIRVVTAVALGAGIGGARLGALF